ncbi:hypothetical protein B566_EDAN018874 [Ephemera danica]|nr:hypothetical protein B566_EDAN018874 [Ephemera danica]
MFLSTTFEREADGSHPYGYVYSRAENPNRELLETAMAVMENGEKALAFASGMASVNAILQALEPGDHILIPEDAYYTLILLSEEVFKQWGLQYSAIDMCGSLAKMGKPVADFCPETAQLLEPKSLFCSAGASAEPFPIKELSNVGNAKGVKSKGYQAKGWPAKGYEVQVNNSQTDWRRTGSLYGVQDVKDTLE